MRGGGASTYSRKILPIARRPADAASRELTRTLSRLIAAGEREAARVEREQAWAVRERARLSQPHVVSSLKARFDDSRSGYEGYTTGYNRSLIGERAHDLLTAISFASSLSEVDEVHLAGTGRAGPWAILTAALCADELASLQTERAWKFHELKDARHQDFLPSALRLGGLEGIIAALAPLPITFSDDAPLSPFIRSAWSASGAPAPKISP